MNSHFLQLHTNCFGTTLCHIFIYVLFVHCSGCCWQVTMPAIGVSYMSPRLHRSPDEARAFAAEYVLSQLGYIEGEGMFRIGSAYPAVQTTCISILLLEQIIMCLSVFGGRKSYRFCKEVLTRLGSSPALLSLWSLKIHQWTLLVTTDFENVK